VSCAFRTEALGRVSSVSVNSSIMATYQYAGAKVVERRYSDPNVYYRPEYNSLGQMTRCYYYKGSDSVLDLAYTYDDNGNITRQKFSHRGLEPSSHYSYDDLDRLTLANYLLCDATNEPNMEGHWKFDETSGTTADDASSNNRDGTLSSSPAWSTGLINNALHFDGTDDYVEISGYKGIGGSNPRTVAACGSNPMPYTPASSSVGARPRRQRARCGRSTCRNGIGRMTAARRWASVAAMSSAGPTLLMAPGAT